MLSAGCGNAGYNSITVQGVVRVNSTPLPSGAVQFVPLQKAMGPTVGGTIDRGNFTVEAVPLGRHTVIFTAVEKGKELPETWNLPRWETVNLIPPDKRAGIVVEVTEDSRRLEFDL